MVALVAVIAGLLVFGWQREQSWAVWRVRAERAESEVTRLTTTSDWLHREGDSLRTVADSLRAHRDTVLLTRWRTIIDTAYAGAFLTLAACQEALGGLRGVCRQAVDSLGVELSGARREADTYRAAVVTMTASADTLKVAVDSLRLLVRAVPVPRKWLGFLPVPRFVVGLGCAASTTAACGVMAGVGFTF